MPRAFLIKKRERAAQGGVEGALIDPVTCDREATAALEGVEGGEERGSPRKDVPGSEASLSDVCETSSPTCSPTPPDEDESEDEIDVESPHLNEEDRCLRASEVLEKQNAMPAPSDKLPEPRRSRPSSVHLPLGGVTFPPQHDSQRSSSPLGGQAAPPKPRAKSVRDSPPGTLGAAEAGRGESLGREGPGKRLCPLRQRPETWDQRSCPIPPLIPSRSLHFSPTRLIAGYRPGHPEKTGSPHSGSEPYLPLSSAQVPDLRSDLVPSSASSPVPASIPSVTPVTSSRSSPPMSVTPLSVFRSSPFHERISASLQASAAEVVSRVPSASSPREDVVHGVGRSPPSPAMRQHFRPDRSSRGSGTEGRGESVATPSSRPSPAHTNAAGGLQERGRSSSPATNEDSRPFSPVSRLYHRKFGRVSPKDKAATSHASESSGRLLQSQPQSEKAFVPFRNGSVHSSLGSSNTCAEIFGSSQRTRMLAPAPKDLTSRSRSPVSIHRSRSPLARSSPERLDFASRRSEGTSLSRRISPPRPTAHRPSSHVSRSPSRPSVALHRSRSPGPTLGLPFSPRKATGHSISLPPSLFHPLTVRPTPVTPTSLHLSPRALPSSPPLALRERRDSVGVPSPTGSDISGRHHGNGGSSGRNSTSSQSPLGSPSGSPPEPPRIPDCLPLPWPTSSSALIGSFPPHNPFLPFNLRLLNGLPAPPPPGSRPSLTETSPFPFRPFPDLTSSAFKGSPFLPPSPYFHGFRYPMNFSPHGSDAGKILFDERRVDSLDLSSRLAKVPFEGLLKFPGHLDALHPGGKHHSFLSSQSELDVGVGGLLEKKKSKENEPVRFHCDSCKKSYSTFSGLSKHKQYHCASQVKKEFNCKYCDRTYISLGALKMHIRTHTLPCKCKLCGKAFSRPWLLQGHIRTHTGEKPFACPHCARAFADRSNLRAHLQTHSDVKKYSCRGCSKTFSRMSLLVKHEDGCCSPSSLH